MTSSETRYTSLPELSVTPLKIAVDAMGGDHAPHEVVRGAILYTQMIADGTVPPAELLLVGDPEAIQVLLDEHGDAIPGISIVPSTQIVEMDEHPTEAVRDKPESSLVKTVVLVKQGLADAAFSAGNTGAFMVASLHILERIEGIRRPAIAAKLPSTNGSACILVDAGANVDVKPSLLVQFALLGAAYAKTVLGIANPRIGLLSNGEEETKGDERAREALPLFKNQAGPKFNFIGYIEGNHPFEDHADVIVCDGFVGNAILKGVEGMANVNYHTLRQLIANAPDDATRAILEDALKKVRARTDYEEFGGAPLLGLNGVSVIAHGRSKARAIATGIKEAALAASSGYVAESRLALQGEKPA